MAGVSNQGTVTWKGLSLALAIASACAGIAGVAHAEVSHRAAQDQSQSQSIPSEEKESAKRVLILLGHLKSIMDRMTEALLRDDFPEKLLVSQPFELITNNLRYVEQELRKDGPPSGLESEYHMIARSLAKARSASALNASLAKQRTSVPQVFQSDINMDGLKKLADYSTERLISMV